jgi:hypothetical protein
MKLIILAILVCSLAAAAIPLEQPPPTIPSAKPLEGMGSSDSILTACTPDTLWCQQDWFVDHVRLVSPFILEWVEQRLYVNEILIWPREQLTTVGVQPSAETVARHELTSRALASIASLSDKPAREAELKRIFEASPLVARTDTFRGYFRVWWTDGTGELVSTNPPPPAQIIDPFHDALYLYESLVHTASLNRLLIVYDRTSESIGETDRAAAWVQIEEAKKGRITHGPISSDGLRAITGR